MYCATCWLSQPSHFPICALLLRVTLLWLLIVVCCCFANLPCKPKPTALTEDMVPTALTEDRLRDNMLHIQRRMAMACKYTCHVPHDGKKLPHNTRPKNTRGLTVLTCPKHAHSRLTFATNYLALELAAMCIDAPWPLSTTSSRICCGSFCGTSGALLAPLQFGPRAPACPSAHAVHHMQSESPGPPEDPPPSAPANCAAPTACQD